VPYKDFSSALPAKNKKTRLEGQPMKIPSSDRYQEVLTVAMILAAWILLILFIASLVFG